MRTSDVTDGTEDGWLYFNSIADGTFASSNAFGSDGTLYFLGNGNASDAIIKWFQTKGTSHNVSLAVATPSADRTLTLPDATGTVALTKGNKVLITETTVSSNTASVDFSSGITDTYTTYVLEFRNLTVSAEANLQMRLGTSGSADSGGIYAQRMISEGRNLTSAGSNNYFFGSNTATAFQFNDANEPLTNDSGFSSNGEIVFHNLRSTSHEKTAIGQQVLLLENASNQIEFSVTRSLGMIYRETSAVNFVSLLVSGADSGQISGGTVRLYGIE
jgi:hypothetical protein